MNLHWPRLAKGFFLLIIGLMISPLLRNIFLIVSRSFIVIFGAHFGGGLHHIFPKLVSWWGVGVCTIVAVALSHSCSSQDICYCLLIKENRSLPLTYATTTTIKVDCIETYGFKLPLPIRKDIIYPRKSRQIPCSALVRWLLLYAFALTACLLWLVLCCWLSLVGSRPRSSILSCAYSLNSFVLFTLLYQFAHAF
jgi:hypothetical protein